MKKLLNIKQILTTALLIFTKVLFSQCEVLPTPAPAYQSYYGGLLPVNNGSNPLELRALIIFVEFESLKEKIASEEIKRSIKVYPNPISNEMLSVEGNFGIIQDLKYTAATEPCLLQKS